MTFVHSPVDNSNHVKKRDEPYDPNGKVVMDNHPLMIMAELKKGVRKIYFLEMLFGKVKFGKF